MKVRSFLLFLLLAAVQLMAQKSIALEDIWKSYLFNAKSVPGFVFQNDGRHYTRMDNNKINQYDLTTGSSTGVILDAATMTGGVTGFKGQMNNYTFSTDETKIIIGAETEPIFRHSSRSYFFVFDRKSQELKAVFPSGKVMYATFNPQADKVAFVYQNNLYYLDLNTNKTVQITTDGVQNAVINGATDWVYEEEFAMDRAFQWAPDGKTLAYYRFDESEVPQFTFSNFKEGMYPETVTFKYPKVGEKNSKVSVFLFDLTAGKSIPVQTDPSTEYIPRIKWTNDPSKLCLYTLNRHQNELDVLLANAKTGAVSTLLQEDSKYYVDIHDNLTFLKNGTQFIWTSEKDGWNHLYLYDLKGNEVRQLTKGKFEVSAFYGVDEKNGVAYYQAAEKSPLQRQVYQISLDGKNKKALANEDGWNNAQFSSTFDYYVLDFSTANAPSSYTVFDRQGNKVRAIEDNANLKYLQKEYGVQPVEFFSFRTKDNANLNGWMIKPANFDPSVQYPVFMFLYGGPGSQQVVDNWRGPNYWWFQMLAQQGYLIACIDNRGTGARGEQFQKSTYLQLGKYETEDQIEAARYLGKLPFADPARIGIFGWSYGGYMSSLCLLKGNDVFKAAIAVAPVTNWKWYDNIYTERYMRTEKENPAGYKDNSPINFAGQLKGNYLLIHGLGDDNVHFQHTAEMTNALIDANKQYDTFFYPNRNHGIAGGNTRLHLYQKMTNFLNEKLKGSTAPVMAPAVTPPIKKGGMPQVKEKLQPAPQVPKQ